MNKKMVKLAGIGLASAIVFTACGNSGGTYATVNGNEIPQSQYDAQLKVYKNMLSAQYGLPASVSNSLINQTVMKEDLDKNKVEITDEDYKVDYDKAIKSFGGPEAYQKALKQFDATDEEYRNILKYETISRKHHEWFIEKHMPSDEQLKSYFKDNKDMLITVDASHILVKTEEEAKKVKERLAKGEKFEDVAKEVSIDKGSAVNGGALGEQTPDSFVPEFAKALGALKEGEVSEPVKSQYGYHIIRLNKRNDSFESKKKDIAAQLTATAYANYIQKLVTSADVKIKGQEVKAEDKNESKENEKPAEPQAEGSQESTK